MWTQGVQTTANDRWEDEAHGILSWSANGGLDYTIDRDHKSKKAVSFPGFSMHTSKVLLCLDWLGPRRMILFGQDTYSNEILRGDDRLSY